MKKCKECNNILDLANFHKSKTGKYGVKGKCKQCSREYYNKNRVEILAIQKMKQSIKLKSPKIYKYKNSKEENRSNNLKFAYGITLKDFDKLNEIQNGKCKICNLPQNIIDKPLFVDHCHKTGKVRGLLCSVCNFGLGYFKDDERILEQAINYLKFYKQE